LQLCCCGLPLSDVGLDTRIRCRALRDKRRLLATKARHVLRRHGALVREYGKLVDVIIPPALSREVVGLVECRRRLVELSGCIHRNLRIASRCIHR
jgi:hypothetical protein